MYYPHLILTAIAIAILIAGAALITRLLKIKWLDELLVRENPAVALVLAGGILGFWFAVEGLYFGNLAETLAQLLLHWCVEGALILALLFTTVAVTDRLLLPKFPIARELVDDQNAGVACVVAGACISAGLVINGALCGYSDTEREAAAELMFYWFAGQVAVWLTLRLIQFMRPFDVMQQLEEDDNLASGIAVGSFLIALGIVARSAILYAGRLSLAEEALGSLIRIVLGIGLLNSVLVILRWVLRRRGTSFVDLELSNSAVPMIFLGVLQIVAALVIGRFLQRPW